MNPTECPIPEDPYNVPSKRCFGMLACSANVPTNISFTFRMNKNRRDLSVVRKESLNVNTDMAIPEHWILLMSCRRLFNIVIVDEDDTGRTESRKERAMQNQE